MAYQLRSAMEFVEDRVLKTFKQSTLKKVKLNHAQCSDVLHNILVGSEESFELLEKALRLLDNFDTGSTLSESTGEESVTAARLKFTQDLCFNALAQMEHCLKRVDVYISLCAEVEYWQTAMRMSHFVSPRNHCIESIPITRSTESFYLLQDFWWSVDLVQFATICLGKLLTTVVDAKFQYDTFKWCKGKCRLVLKEGGECDYTVLKDENKEDNICLHHKVNLVDSDKEKLLRQLKMEVGNNLTWFPSSGRNHERRVKMFLKQVLEGPAVRVGYLPSTLKIEYHDIKLSDRILGQGSFGVIIEGKWHGETVAVKYIKLGDDFEIKKQLLEKEVALLASLHHHNIVRLIGFTYDEETKNCVIIMERMQMNLRSLIKHNLYHISKDLPSVKIGSVPRFLENETPFPLDVTIDLLLQIIEGMCHLRDFRVMHRDLRAENILVNKCAQAVSMLSMPSVATNSWEFERGHFYHAKVADFGTSKSQMKDSEFFTKGKGTIKWMAPEVLEATFEREDDTLHYSWNADMYSFGITCSEILTGELPFQDVSGRKLLDLISAGVRPPLPPDCPDSLKRLVCECWDTNPQNRPNCWEARERLWGCKLEMFLHHREKMSVGQTFCNNVQRFINHTVLESARANSGGKGAVKPFIRTMITNVRQLYGFKQEVAPRIPDYPIECKPGLDWSTRLSVLKEIAEMLLCFHYAGQPTIMFWNIIAQNIFLDNFWSPKILNLFYMDLRECQFHKRVYFPPDYPIYDHTSKSLDVFKFGILILWAISGMKSANLQRPPEQQFWSEWVGMLKDDKIDLLVDPALRGNFDRKEVQELVQVALLCCRHFTFRPDMKMVTLMLKGDIPISNWYEGQRDSAARIIQNAWKHWKNLQADSHEKNLFHEMQFSCDLENKLGNFRIFVKNLLNQLRELRRDDDLLIHNLTFRVGNVYCFSWKVENVE